MRSIRLPRRLSTVALLCLATGLTQAAEAELETIIVSASRLQEDGGRLPIAWSKIDADALELTGHVHINEAMQRVPGAWISRGNGQESLTALRSPVLTGAGSCGAFFMAADGISLRAPGFCNVNQLFDANTEQAGSIEVIKGPATSLYGSNAMHGVINVLSYAPTENLDHSLSLEAGPYDYYRAKYHYRDTVGRHGISVNANGVTDGGYKDDSGYDQQKVTLRHDYQGDIWSVRTVLDGANLNQETSGFVQGYKAYEVGSLRKFNPNPEAYRDAWSLRLYSAATRELGDRHSLTLTPYLRDNDMEFLMHFLPWQPTEENGHSSLGLKTVLHSDLGSLRWANGVDLEYTDAMLKEIQEEEWVSDNQPQGVHYNYRVDAAVAGAYSQLRSQWQSPWEVSGGLRLEYTYYDYDNRASDGSACIPEASDCRFYRPEDRDDDFTDLSLNAGVSYRLSDDTLAYLRLARGFRAPEATELYRLQSGQRTADLDSEELDNIELGLRGSLWQRLGYDTSVYYMQKDEVIFQDADRQNVSGAKTRHYGLELSANYRISDDWMFSLDATLAEHQYDSRVRLLGASEDIKGNDIDTAPNMFGSARLSWNFSGLSGQDSVAELEWVYMDEYYLDPDNAHKYDGHSLVNLRTSTSLGPRWQATVRVTNLLDEEYAERADFGFGQYRYFVGQPRGAYVEMRYFFADRRS